MQYHALPIDDRLIERSQRRPRGRPDLMAGRTSLTVYEGMIGMSENVFINIKNRSHTITAEVAIPTGGANGVILAQAGRFGGWSLYLKDGKPTYAYNFLGLHTYKVAATEPLPAGKATIRFEFTYDGAGLARAALADPRQRPESGRRTDRPHAANIFSADEGADVGLDGETPVTETTRKATTSSPARSRKSPSK